MPGEPTLLPAALWLKCPGEACATPGIPLAMAFRLARGLGAQGGPGCRLRAASLLVWRWKDTGLHGQLPLHSGCGGAASVVLRLQAGPGTQGPPPLKAQGQSDDGIPWRRVAGPRRLPCGTQFAVRPLWPRSPPSAFRVGLGACPGEGCGAARGM